MSPSFADPSDWGGRTPRLSRRECLRLVGAGLGLVGIGVLGACAPSTPAPAATSTPDAEAPRGAPQSVLPALESARPPAQPAKPAGGEPKRGGVLNVGQD